VSRNRVIYQTDLLYVGPTGYRSATGAHAATGGAGVLASDPLRFGYGNILAATSGTNLIGVAVIGGVTTSQCVVLGGVADYATFTFADVPSGSYTVSWSYSYDIV